MPRTFQDWVHWLELGSGAHLVRRLSVGFAVLLLSALVAYKQFHGPATEVTLSEAVVGRQLADGRGYTTLVNYPQAAAWVQQNGGRWGNQPFPELYAAPLHPLTIAGALKLIPQTYRNYLFDTTPRPPGGFLPDYLLLLLNLMLLWIAAAQTFHLARALFDRAVAWAAVAGMLLSAAIWNDVVAVNGTPLAMVVLLGLLQLCVRVDRGTVDRMVPFGSLIATGAVSALLFLLDYAAGLAVLPVIGFVWLRFAGERWKAVSAVIAGFLLLASPWCTYRIVQTGSPVGLAWHAVALKPDKTAADPEIARATVSAAAPVLELTKLGNKGLSYLNTAIAERLWSGGGIFFTAFFVSGFLYRFREKRVNRLRALFLAVLGTLVLAYAFLSSGEGDRHPLVFASPLIIVFGAGFCAVLIASSERLAGHAAVVFSGLLLLQAVPLAKDLLEPRTLHFHYPPYYPGLFVGMRDEMILRGGENPGWMCDVPAGAAWYSGIRVWGQPAALRDFYAIGSEQPMIALVLTPRTLDRPYFAELGRPPPAGASRVGDWHLIYSSLASERPITGFPLSLPQKIADNFYVLIDPTARPWKKNASSR